eukprot:CAMPEP_0204529784 /NCGR_PEP_ID=MMETSP0661-20131031/10258_1 /ASSEMBLY_ACC=CAM_ASM_000606 /TAXON_ID=109239 /ORGANISM="Alexandrium margalefi, Strain AMGDE01CS-322" /LENGTH=57 /DNA_ID=CAMNT_0051535831 /DNA_START=70 /DNA_END=243 /DNA_ORIENTATION=-
MKTKQLTDTINKDVHAKSLNIMKTKQLTDTINKDVHAKSLKRSNLLTALHFVFTLNH